jgi:seryl-tRNA synthetase
MALRYRPSVSASAEEGQDKGKGKGKAKSTAFPHTLNGSGLAVGR